MKLCSLNHCTRNHEAKGYCKSHYKSLLKYGDPMYVENRKQLLSTKRQENENRPKRGSREGTCSVEGCGNAIKSKRLCEKHYARQRRTGKLTTSSIESGSIKTCLAIGCTRAHKTNGYCETHYANFRKKGSPHLPKVIKYCGVENCTNLHHARGLCQKHYHVWEANIKKFQLDHQLNEGETSVGEKPIVAAKI